MLRWLFAAGLCSLMLLQANGAQAQQARPKSGPEQPPILFSADELQTDEDLGLVVAKGHVQVSQGLQTLLADTVTYNRHTDTVTASGHVSLQQATGEILFGDFMELTNRFDDGFIKDVRALLSDRSRMAGNTARRTDGVRTEIRRGIYSPCELCKEDPSQPPLWQLRGERVIHNEETHKIEYYDAVMEIDGIPVLYSPYFSHPDPTVKRQSGFLAPTFGNSSTLGAHATIPYFWAIAPDRDLTLSPIFTTNQGVVADAEYRQRYSNGELRLEGSLNNGKSPDDQSRSTIRGHIDGVGRWDLSDQWRAGFDAQRASDQTYEEVFHYGGTQNFLTSRLFGERFTRNSFLSIDNYTFQTLRQFTNDSAQPLVAPVVNYHWIGDPDALGGRLSTDANFLDLNRFRGTGSHRLSLGTAWTKPFNGLIGDVFTFSASVRGDGYYTTDIQPTANERAKNALVGRAFPQLALDWRYPWVRRGETTSQTIEPEIMFVAGPKGLNPNTISNEDSLAFDLSDSDLFTPNRFAGLDRVDSGDRVDYGFRASSYGQSSGIGMLIGQSYRVQNNGGFEVGSGLEDKLSDIVGRFVITPNEFLDLTYRYRLSKTNFTLQREEVGVATGPPQLRLNVSYIKLPPDLLSNDTGKREQIGVSATAGLSRYWTLAVSTTKNLTGDLGTVSSAASAIYQDDCLAFIAKLSQSGVTNRDVRPGASLVFSVVFKNLGEVTAPAFATEGIR